MEKTIEQSVKEEVDEKVRIILRNVHFKKSCMGPHTSRLLKLYNKLSMRNTTLMKRAEKWEPCHEIERGLYLGGIPQPCDDPTDSYNMSIAKAPHGYIFHKEVRLIVSIIDHSVKWHLPEEVLHLMMIGVDHPETEICKFFEPVSDKIREYVLARKVVLVHCHAGFSRSSTMLAAYYLKYGLPKKSLRGIIDSLENTHNPESLRRPTVEEVLEFISSKRGWVCPNYGFLNQLIKYEDYLSRKK